MPDPRWGAYPETILVFSGDSDLTIDLREKVSPSAREALIVMGLEQPFGIVTAFNPLGVVLSKHENEERMAKLENELESAGESFIHIDAMSEDRTHCERSVAIVASRDRVVEIAKRWEQLAIFWWDGSSFWLYGAMIDLEPLELPAHQ